MGRELRQLAALGIVRKSKETGQSAHYVYVKTEPVTNPSNPSSERTKGTPQVTPEAAAQTGIVKASGKASGKMSGKTSGKILAALGEDHLKTIPELSSLIGVTERSIERNIRELQQQGKLRRVGPAKGGHWEVVKKE